MEWVSEKTGMWMANSSKKEVTYILSAYITIDSQEYPLTNNRVPTHFPKDALNPSYKGIRRMNISFCVRICQKGWSIGVERK